jgi:hypothetical protein
MAKKIKRPAVESSPPASNTHTATEKEDLLTTNEQQRGVLRFVSIEKKNSTTVLCHPIESTTKI